MRRAVAAIVLLATLALSACATPAAPSTALPDGLTVSVYQNRVDVGNRKLSVTFHNDTGSKLTITRLEFTSPQFVGAALWPKESTTIAAGTAISLAVQLPEPDCTAQNPIPSVEFDYQLEDGRKGTTITEPVDELTRLPQIFVEDCVEVAVHDVVDVQAVTLPRDGMVGGRLVAEIDVTLTPTGADGSVVFEQTGGTTLLTTVDAAGIPNPAMTLDVTVDGTDAPSTMTLVYAPGRCDAHAIAEDKRGTIFPISVTTSTGLSGILYLASADDVKVALYDFARRACGFTE
jgi:hypothetical protein